MYAYRNPKLRFAAKLIDKTGKIFFKEKQSAGHNPRRILIIKTDHLGDCYLMTPLFSYLKKQYPGALIDIACLESSIPVFENNPYINKVIPYNKRGASRPPFNSASSSGLLKFTAYIRKNKYNLFIDPRGDLISAIIGFFSGIPLRIGFEEEEAGGFLYNIRLSYNRLQHETKKYAVLLDALGIEVKEWQPALFPSENEKRTIDDKLCGIKRPFAVIHPGAGLPYKMWPVERWASAAEYFPGRNYSVVFSGASTDKEIVNRIISLMPCKENLYNCAGQFSLRETYYFISQSSFFAGNDSALGHFAGALGIPALILMNNAVDSNRWKPAGQKVKVISGKNGSHNCLLDNCAYPCPNMENIAVSNVIDGFASLM